MDATVPSLHDSCWSSFRKHNNILNTAAIFILLLLAPHNVNARKKSDEIQNARSKLQNARARVLDFFILLTLVAGNLGSVG